MSHGKNRYCFVSKGDFLTLKKESWHTFIGCHVIFQNSCFKKYQLSSWNICLLASESPRKIFLCQCDWLWKYELVPVSREKNRESPRKSQLKFSAQLWRRDKPLKIDDNLIFRRLTTFCYMHTVHISPLRIEISTTMFLDFVGIWLWVYVLLPLALKAGFLMVVYCQVHLKFPSPPQIPKSTKE